VHSKTNLNQSADSNDYNAPIPKYTKKEMVALDAKLSNRYFSLNTLKV
jgi:hypothetical protein